MVLCAAGTPRCCSLINKPAFPSSSAAKLQSFSNKFITMRENKCTSSFDVCLILNSSESESLSRWLLRLPCLRPADPRWLQLLFWQESAAVITSVAPAAEAAPKTLHAAAQKPGDARLSQETREGRPEVGSLLQEEVGGALIRPALPSPPRLSAVALRAGRRTQRTGGFPREFCFRCLAWRKQLLWTGTRPGTWLSLQGTYFWNVFRPGLRVSLQPAC